MQIQTVLLSVLLYSLQVICVRRLIHAFDCSRPGNVEDFRLPGPRDLGSCIFPQELTKAYNVTYTVFRPDEYHIHQGYRCKAWYDKVFTGCGPDNEGIEASRVDNLSVNLTARQCTTLKEQGIYFNGRYHPIMLDEVSIQMRDIHGNTLVFPNGTWGCDGVEFEGGKHGHYESAVHTDVQYTLISMEQYQSNSTHIQSVSDGIWLPCLPQDKTCVMAGQTHMWGGTFNPCPLHMLQTLQGAEVQGPHGLTFVSTKPSGYAAVSDVLGLSRLKIN